ncbi:MAG TPA: ornithine cyclodeaminase family protein [Aestuariivirgaceae bacterium]|jgi:ornithine cyclodeaminase
MAQVSITYLSGPDIARLPLSDDEILDAVEDGLRAQGSGEAVIEPRVHLVPDRSFNGHFNVLRGYVAPLRLAGVKIVGDFVDNYKRGLPSEMALINLFDPETGSPKAILDATAITDMRTGALTALGAKHLARRDAKTLGHVGARGTSYWNIRLLDKLFSFDKIRVHSRRKESREAFAARLEKDLQKRITIAPDWRSCLEGADILVEASRLEARAEHFKRDFVKKGALVIPYGTVSALELSLPAIMDKIVVDDLGQFRAGKFGALRPHIDQGLLSEADVHAELAEIVVGTKAGREREDETILFWHRGLSLSDIALAAAMLRKAEELEIGQSLAYS